MAGATVGITYKFPQRGFKPAPDVDAIMHLPLHKWMPSIPLWLNR